MAPSPDEALGGGAADALPEFDYDPRTRVVFGPGTLARVGDVTAGTGAKRVLLVTDPGIAAAGHALTCQKALERSDMNVTVYQDVQANPTTEDVDRGVVVARDARVEAIVAIGGGSAMDCAKGVNFLLTNGGKMSDYWGVGKARLPMLPLIAIPTTAGTGSEAQSFALISDAVTHVKMACGDKKAACRVAILDPDLTISMPAGVTSATGIDAVSHAIESYVSTKRNPISQLFGRRAWRLLAESFPAVVKLPQQRMARGAMLLGAHLAGAAIENSMLGAAHALANPLTARFGLTHGLAVGLMLPHVIEFNALAVGRLYARLAFDAGACEAENPQAAEHLARLVARFLKDAGIPQVLTEIGATENDLAELAQAAAKQWTGGFNPRPVGVEDYLQMYRKALHEPYSHAVL